jgi:hypothetical protein
MAVAASARVEIPAARDWVDAEKFSSSEAFTNAREEMSGSATWIAPRSPRRMTAERRKPVSGAVPAEAVVDTYFSSNDGLA